jgi:hypothetical protein
MASKSKKKAKRKARPPERDYSHRALLDKLGVKSGQQVAVLGIADAAFLKELAGRVPDFSHEMPQSDAELIFCGAESLGELAQLKALPRVMQRNGAVWVVYPKGQKHIRKSDVFAARKSAGFTDNKVARFSETHTEPGIETIRTQNYVTTLWREAQEARARLGFSRS